MASIAAMDEAYVVWADRLVNVLDRQYEDLGNLRFDIREALKTMGFDAKAAKKDRKITPSRFRSNCSYHFSTKLLREGKITKVVKSVENDIQDSESEADSGGLLDGISSFTIDLFEVQQLLSKDPHFPSQLKYTATTDSGAEITCVEGKIDIVAVLDAAGASDDSLRKNVP